jgi:hypothetical protein
VIGFLIGAVLFHLPHAKATTSTHVFITTVGVTDFKAISTDVSGAIVGMSCVPKPMPKAPDAVVCYVATASN